MNKLGCYSSSGSQSEKDEDEAEDNEPPQRISAAEAIPAKKETKRAKLQQQQPAINAAPEVDISAL